jgi:hypothetical protein
MEKMLQLFMARIDEWAGLIELDGDHINVCGEPPQELVDKMSYGAGPGGLSVCRPLGGFTRLQLRD